MKFASEAPMTYLKQWLKRNNMTRQQLADELDMSLSSVEKMASGSAKVRRVVKYALMWVEKSAKP